MLSESSSAASYKLIARAKSPWADLVSASCISCAEREAVIRSQPDNPKMKRAASQTPAAFIVADQRKIEDAGPILSGHDIVANLLTCDPTRTSILFLYWNVNSAFHSALTRRSFHWSNLPAEFR